MPAWDDEVDVLVCGAGMGGLCAALIGAHEGLRVLLCEKSDRVGGTTSTSAGTVWIPGAAGAGADAVAAARRYLDAEIGAQGEPALREAFLASGAAALDYLAARTEVRFASVARHPDYHPQQPGWTMGGRALAALPFDGRLLGADFALVRPPIAPFMVLGGMMVGKDDIPHLIEPFRSLRSLAHVAGLLLRHASDRLRHPRGTRLVMGNALVARLLFSLRRKDVPIWFGTGLEELIKGESRIEGAVIRRDGTQRRVRARHGVVLATGGFSASPSLRRELMGGLPADLTLAHDGDSGDGIAAARACGAELGGSAASPAFWMPASILDGAPRTLFPHIVLDRAKPGLIAVNAAGRRFVNEADSYHDFVLGMFRAHATTPSIPAHLVCDRGFLRDYGLGLVHPGTSDTRIAKFTEAGYLRVGTTLPALALAIGVDPDGLVRSVDEHNAFARAGTDDAFGKGSTALNRHNGDPENVPNPCLRPIEHPPYFAVAVWPADLATSRGLRTDADARVLDARGAPIRGLYACGNDMSSIMAGVYPGPGVTLGPALVFAYRAIMYITAGAALSSRDDQPREERS